MKSIVLFDYMIWFCITFIISISHTAISVNFENVRWTSQRYQFTTPSSNLCPRYRSSRPSDNHNEFFHRKPSHTSTLLTLVGWTAHRPSTITNASARSLHSQPHNISTIKRVYSVPCTDLIVIGRPLDAYRQQSKFV